MKNPSLNRVKKVVSSTNLIIIGYTIAIFEYALYNFFFFGFTFGSFLYELLIFILPIASYIFLAVGHIQMGIRLKYNSISEYGDHDIQEIPKKNTT